MINILFEKTSQNQDASRRLRPIWKAFFLIAIIFILIFSYTQIALNLNYQGIKLMKKNIIKIFSFQNNDPNFPSNSVLNNSLNYLWLTIKITITGTFLGFFFAMITSFLAAKNIANKALSFLVKTIFLFLRSFPTIIFIYAIQAGFQKELAGILILFWFSWIWSNKYLTEIIQNINIDGYKSFIKEGHGKIYSFKKQIFDRCKIKFITIFLYSLDSNIRWTTMLATVGVIGIGFFINQNIPNKFEYIGIPLFILLILILIIELISIFFNKILLKVNSKSKKKYNWKKFIKVMFLILISGLSFYELSSLQYDFSQFKYFIKYFNFLRHVNLSDWASTNLEINPWLQILKLFYQCVFSISIATIYGILTAIFTSEKLQSKKIWIISKVLNSFLKIFPVIILFYVFNPIFNNAATLGALLLGIHSGTIIAKQTSESINNINENVIKQHRKNGYSQFWIIIKYVWPFVKKDFISYTRLRFEVIFRNMIILGILGFSLIGLKLDQYNNRNNLVSIATTIWPIMITIFGYNIFPSLSHYFKRRLKWS